MMMMMDGQHGSPADHGHHHYDQHDYERQNMINAYMVDFDDDESTTNAMVNEHMNGDHERLSIDDLQTMKQELDLSGTLLGKTWSELSRLLSRYQAELLTKYAQVDAMGAFERRRMSLLEQQFDEKNKEITRLERLVHERDIDIEAKDNEVFLLRTEVSNLRDELTVKDGELNNKDSVISRLEAEGHRSKRHKSRKRKKHSHDRHEEAPKQETVVMKASEQSPPVEVFLTPIDVANAVAESSDSSLGFSDLPAQFVTTTQYRMHLPHTPQFTFAQTDAMTSTPLTSSCAPATHALTFHMATSHPSATLTSVGSSQLAHNIASNTATVVSNQPTSTHHGSTAQQPANTSHSTVTSLGAASYQSVTSQSQLAVSSHPTTSQQQPPYDRKKNQQMMDEMKSMQSKWTLKSPKHTKIIHKIAKTVNRSYSQPCASTTYKFDSVDEILSQFTAKIKTECASPTATGGEATDDGGGAYRTQTEVQLRIEEPSHMYDDNQCSNDGDGHLSGASEFESLDHLDLMNSYDTNSSSDEKRPHLCSICGRGFKHKHHLTEHYRLHTGGNSERLVMLGANRIFIEA